MSNDVEGLMKANDVASALAAIIKAKGLDESFVGHALICEALILMLGCDRQRAHALANGFISLAVADQRRYLDNERDTLLDAAIKGDVSATVVHAEFDRSKSLLKGSTSIPSYNWQRVMDMPSHWAVMT